MPLITTYTPEQKIGNALACCAGVAKLRLTHGGWPVAHAVSGSVKMDEPVKAPKRGHQIKRTLPRF